MGINSNEYDGEYCKKNNLKILRIENPDDRKIAKDFINRYHSYINYADRPSRKLYWLLFENNKVVGVFALASAFVFPKNIKNFIKIHNLKFNEIGNNIVYALFGYKGKNIGTRFLKLLRQDAIIWWKERYNDDLKALQTFILPPRTGALYKADNWIQLGKTTGGKTLTTKTLYGDSRLQYPSSKIQIKKFKSGEIKYLLREFKETVPKLIFMKLLTKNNKKDTNIDIK